MKNRLNPLFPIVATLSFAGISLTLAADQYWNPSPLSDDWANSVWSATSGGGSLTTWTAANNAIFDQAGTYTATINAAQTATNLNIKAGTVTFAGTNTLSATTITIDSGATLTGASERYVKSGTTALIVNGTLNQTTSALTAAQKITVTSGSGSIVLAGGFRTGGDFNFAGNISGTGSLTTEAAGIFTLSGNNTYAGDTLIRSGNTIRVGSATALSANSLLRFGGGTNIVELTGANFSRTVGNSAGNVRFHGGADGAGSSGFAAVNADRTVALNGTVTWGAGLFNPTIFTLGSAASTHKVTLTTGINLNAATRTINTTDGSAAIEAEISGVLSGAAGSNLTKTGTGVLVLSNGNTYAGTTTISGGSLRLGNGGTTGALATTSAITNNANLTFNRSNAVVQGTDFSSAAITGSGSLTQAGAGTTTLNVANSYAGATTVSTGTLQITDAGALGTTAAGTTVSSGATLALSGGLAVGAEALNLNGTGLSNVGAISSISGVNSMSGAVTLAGATRIGVEADTLELSGAIGGTQSLNAVGAGKLILSGGGTFGQVTVGNSAVVSGGNLEWKAGTGTTAGTYFGVGDNVSASFTMSGGSLTASPTTSLFVGSFSSSAVTGTMSVTGGTFTMGNNLAIYVGGGGYNGNVSGSGILNVSNGTFSTGTTTGTFRLGANAAAQTGNGEINLSGGVFETARSVTKGAQGTATVNFDGGTYKLRAAQATMFGAGVVTNVKAGGLIVDTNTFNGTIGTDLTAGSPSGGLTKQGTGTLTLSGTNSYTGVTTLTAGTVSIATLGDGGVSGNLGAATNAAANIVFGGGTLQVSAASAASSDRGFTINAASSGTFNVSSASGALTLTASVPTTTGVLLKIGLGSLTLDPGAVSQSLGALSANGGEMILKSGTYATTAKDAAVSAYNVGAGARGGTLTIDGATLNVGGAGNNLKIAANGNGNLSIKSGTVTSNDIVIGHNGIGGATQSGGTVTTTNLFHQDSGLGSSYTLTGGSLTAKNIYNNPTTTSGTFTLNLNGGTLKSASGTTNLIDNTVTTGSQISVLLGAGNTVIDTTNSNATIARPMGDMPSAVGTFTKAGTNTLTLTQASTYTGATQITGGTLALNGTASIDSPSIIVGASTTFDVSGVTGGYTLGSTQTISGTGSVAGAMTVTGTLSPGNSPGALSTGNQTWLTGSDYNWQVLDALGVAGTDYDTIAITGTLDLSSLTAAGFSINLWSLASIGPDVSGNAVNFLGSNNYSWPLASATTAITGFNAANFFINVGANNGTAGFSNGLDGGAFSVSQSGNNLLLNFTAVPEPRAALLGGLALLALLRRRR